MAITFKKGLRSSHIHPEGMANLFTQGVCITHQISTLDSVAHTVAREAAARYSVLASDWLVCAPVTLLAPDCGKVGIEMDQTKRYMKTRRKQMNDCVSCTYMPIIHAHAHSQHTHTHMITHTHTHDHTHTHT